jgi:hypothetical protein
MNKAESMKAAADVAASDPMIVFERRIQALEVMLGAVLDRLQQEDAEIAEAKGPIAGAALQTTERASISYEIPGLGHLILNVPADGETLEVIWRTPTKQRVSRIFTANEAGLSGKLYEMATSDPAPYRRRRR